MYISHKRTNNQDHVHDTDQRMLHGGKTHLEFVQQGCYNDWWGHSAVSYHTGWAAQDRDENASLNRTDHSKQFTERKPKMSTATKTTTEYKPQEKGNPVIIFMHIFSLLMFSFHSRHSTIKWHKWKEKQQQPFRCQQQQRLQHLQTLRKW